MAAAAPSSSGPAHYRARFGDTTLTKVFVGGLAWETPSEGLRQHFERYGDILEAVVITDRQTGRSKGYGFVTFRDPEAARRSVQDPNPMIAGRRANCNIASLGPPRPAPPPGRDPRGPHLQAPPPYMSRALSQMTPTNGVFYPSQYGYWYPPDYQYQQALLNPQMVQHYYAQLYGPTSPSQPPYPYMGYIPSPRTGLPPAPAQQQAARQPFVHQLTAQIQGAFVPGPSLPPHFRLQLPPHATSMPPANTTGSPSTQPPSAAGATNKDNQDA